jgi:signal transduction histidine kinase
VLHVSTVRFLIFGRPTQFLAGVAFSVIGLVTHATRVAAEFMPDRVPSMPYILLIIWVIAAGLFMAGLVTHRSILGPMHRTRFVSMVAASVLGTFLVCALEITLLGDALPPAINTGARELLEQNAVFNDVLPGQAQWLVAANGVLALLLIVATVGYTLYAERLGNSQLRLLAVALTLLSFGQAHALLFPPVSFDYVSTATGFRLAAYVLLLVALLRRIGQDIMESARGQERLRLSRELHDGLLQQLSLLGLKLGRAANPEREITQRTLDLQQARDVLEVALIEARHATTALRSGSIPWLEFCSSLERLAGEFEVNHGLAVEIHTEGHATVAPELQLAMLRILHEACSNAIRHGNASRVGVLIAARGDQLEMRVSDNGRGFESVPSHYSGLGLRSMRERIDQLGGSISIESRPNEGATIQVGVSLSVAGASLG